MSVFLFETASRGELRTALALLAIDVCGGTRKSTHVRCYVPVERAWQPCRHDALG